MKRFLAYYFVVVTLLTGVVSTTGFRNLQTTNVTVESHHKPSFPDNNQSFFSASDLFLSAGVNNEQIRLSNSIQIGSFRILSNSLNAFRVNYSTQLSHQKYSTGSTVFLLNSANKQLDGYYLYHLRKILI